MDKLKLSTANLVILIAGAVILIASFFAFHKTSGTSIVVNGIRVGGGSASFSAWSRGFFLIATIPALIGAVMAAQVAVEAFAPAVKLPERVLGFTWTQIHLVLGFQATIMMLAFLIQDTGFDKGIGLFLMLLAAIALLVGAVLRMQEQPSGFTPPAV
jgi:hypothetical protein